MSKFFCSSPFHSVFSIVKVYRIISYSQKTSFAKQTSFIQLRCKHFSSAYLIVCSFFCLPYFYLVTVWGAYLCIIVWCITFMFILSLRGAILAAIFHTRTWLTTRSVLLVARTITANTPCFFARTLNKFRQTWGRFVYWHPLVGQASIFANNPTVVRRGRSCAHLLKWSPMDCSLR